MANGAAGVGWRDPAQVQWYLQRIDRLAARAEGERALLEAITGAPRRVLDLGCGDGRLGELVATAYESVESVLAVDRSEPMLARAHERLAGRDRPRFEFRWHDLRDAITDLGTFDVVVSGFAIHHLEDNRKKALFGEVATGLIEGGVFVNLEVVQSSSPRRHAEFLAAIGRGSDDPEDKLAGVQEQLGWMCEAGFAEVECLWRWSGFAVLVGVVPAVAG